MKNIECYDYNDLNLFDFIGLKDEPESMLEFEFFKRKIDIITENAEGSNLMARIALRTIWIPFVKNSKLSKILLSYLHFKLLANSSDKVYMTMNLNTTSYELNKIVKHFKDDDILVLSNYKVDLKIKGNKYELDDFNIKINGKYFVDTTESIETLCSIASNEIRDNKNDMVTKDLKRIIRFKIIYNIIKNNIKPNTRLLNILALLSDCQQYRRGYGSIIQFDNGNISAGCTLIPNIDNNNECLNGMCYRNINNSNHNGNNYNKCKSIHAEEMALVLGNTKKCGKLLLQGASHNNLLKISTPCKVCESILDQHLIRYS